MPDLLCIGGPFNGCRSCEVPETAVAHGGYMVYTLVVDHTCLSFLHHHTLTPLTAVRILLAQYARCPVVKGV